MAEWYPQRHVVKALHQVCLGDALCYLLLRAAGPLLSPQCRVAAEELVHADPKHRTLLADMEAFESDVQRAKAMAGAYLCDAVDALSSMGGGGGGGEGGGALQLASRRLLDLNSVST